MRRPEGARAVAVVVPRRPSRTGAVDSQLLAAAHLARGFIQLLGRDSVVLLTEQGEALPGELLAEGVRAGSGPVHGRLRRLPRGARVMVGDAQALARRRRLRPLTIDRPLRLVVQYHHRFQDVGARLARSAGCPLVLRVEALEIEEQRDWGIRPRSSGRLIESLGEHRLLRRADVVSAVSPPLTELLARVGVDRDRLQTAPNGVDLSLFRPVEPVGAGVLREYGLEGRFLIGWSGGFRPYHGLEQVERLVASMEKQLPGATLCLLGTGPLRPRLEEVALRHPASLRLLPPVPQQELPSWLSAFHVCIQFAQPDGAQHYSPLKVLEYLACARPVVAPAVRTSDLLTDGLDALLVPPADPKSALAALTRFSGSVALRRSLGARGRTTAEQRGGWETVARSMLSAAGLDAGTRA